MRRNSIETPVDDAFSPLKTLQIPKYKSLKLVLERVDTIGKMESLNEIISYENSHGYRSIGSLIDEKIDNLDYELYCNEKTKFKEFLSANKSTLDTIILDDEIYVEPLYSENIFRYVANGSRLFQVGDTVAKIFKYYTVATHINNINALLELKDDFNGLIDSSLFLLSSYQNVKGEYVDILNHLNCAGFTYNGIKGNFRNIRSAGVAVGKKRVSFSSTWIQDIAPNPLCHLYLYVFTFKASKRGVVCYYPVKSHISTRWDLDLHWYSSDYHWNNELLSKGWTTKYTRQFSKVVFGKYCCDALGVIGVHYKSLFVSAYVPSSEVLEFSKQ